MAVVEFQWVPPRWAKLSVADTITQGDVDTVFSSLDTTGWVTPPTWDPTNNVVRWQVIATPYGPVFEMPVGSVIAVERPYTCGVPAGPSTQPQVVTYAPGQWSDTAVTYL